MIALKAGSKPGSSASSVSVVDRVRKLLSDVHTALEDPQDFEKGAQWMNPLKRKRASRDLEEIEDRLQKLRSFFPELGGVEAGPLVGRARELLSSRPIGFGGRGISE